MVIHQIAIAHIDLNNQVSANIVIERLDYKERADNRVLDEVYGWAPGVELIFRKQFYHFMVAPSLMFVKDKFGYKGGLNNGPADVVLTDDTDNTFFTGRVKLAYIFEFHSDYVIMPYVSVGYRHWWRNVPPIGDIVEGNERIGVNLFTEEYEHKFAMAGLEVQHSFNDKLAYRAYAAIGSTFDAHIQGIIIHPLNVGKTYELNLNLGSARIYELGLEAQYQLSERTAVTAGIEYTEFEYRKSKVNMLGILEPDSKTRELMFKLGIAFALV